MALSTDSISEQIRQILRDRILDGTFHPGQRLLEHALAEEFMVSRTPIREAVLRLEVEGLVTTNPRRGISVSMVSKEQVLELFEIRLLLEPMAVELASQRRTQAELERLREALQAMDETLSSLDDTKLDEHHAQFHKTIYQAAHSPRLLEILSGLLGDIRRFARQSYTFFGRDKEAMREHWALLDAISQGDGQRAFQLSRIHIEQSKKVYMKVYQTQTTQQ
ncbi:GntR family transcriptional regulator [Alicyclobacillus sp. SO9]|uniref:GntR family transcriptional regulator n=1 Tax=Alicyclobacillus sp. SO9 TaxID=2665646 RepID=UPI0018E8DA26|nr:GntR family transcriptional regulator [Alicyclobacillus sp. SO9]QQE78655.1 GntR family transcriptional regulator [Alicyclobacillus sp. SO9]